MDAVLTTEVPDYEFKKQLSVHANASKQMDVAAANEMKKQYDYVMIMIPGISGGFLGDTFFGNKLFPNLEGDDVTFNKILKSLKIFFVNLSKLSYRQNIDPDLTFNLLPEYTTSTAPTERGMREKQKRHDRRRDVINIKLDNIVTALRNTGIKIILCGFSEGGDILYKYLFSRRPWELGENDHIHAAIFVSSPVPHIDIACTYDGEWDCSGERGRGKPDQATWLYNNAYYIKNIKSTPDLLQNIQESCLPRPRLTDLVKLKCKFSTYLAHLDPRTHFNVLNPTNVKYNSEWGKDETLCDHRYSAWNYSSDDEGGVSELEKDNAHYYTCSGRLGHSLLECLKQIKEKGPDTLFPPKGFNVATQKEIDDIGRKKILKSLPNKKPTFSMAKMPTTMSAEKPSEIEDKKRLDYYDKLLDREDISEEIKEKVRELRVYLIEEIQMKKTLQQKLRTQREEFADAKKKSKKAKKKRKSKTQKIKKTQKHKKKKKIKTQKEKEIKKKIKTQKKN